MVLVLCEIQSALSRIWTNIAVSISYDHNHYTTGTSKTPQAPLEVYDKLERVVFQTSSDYFIYLFLYLGVYVSPQICQSFFKAALFSLK